MSASAKPLAVTQESDEKRLSSDLPMPENQWSGGSHASIKSASLRAFERVQSIGSLVLRVLKGFPPRNIKEGKPRTI